MSKFFSDSDSESYNSQDDEVESSVESVDHNLEPNNFWFEFTDDDADEGEKEKHVSKERKSFDALETNVYKFETAYYDKQDYAAAKSHMEKYIAQFHSHRERFPLWRSSMEGEDLQNNVITASQQMAGLFDDADAAPEEEEEDAESTTKVNKMQQSKKRELDKLREAFKAELEVILKNIAQMKASGEGQRGDSSRTSGSTEVSVLRSLEKVWMNTIKGKKSEATNRILRDARDIRTSTPLDHINVSIRAALASFILEEESRTSTCITTSDWDTIFHHLLYCVNTILDRKLRIVDSFAAILDSTNPENVVVKPNYAVIPGGIHNTVSALQVQLSRAMKHSKTFQPDLIRRENRLVDLIDRVYGITKQPRCLRTLMDLIGSRNQSAHKLLFGMNENVRTNSLISESVADTVEKITSLMAVGTDDYYVGILYRAYQYALAGQFRRGKDILLRVTKFIDEDQKKAPMLFCLKNRVVAQLGVASFVEGNFEDSFETLRQLFDVYNTYAEGRDKSHPNWKILSLLGQHNPARRDELELHLAFDDLLIPRHFHINFDLLELAAGLSAVMCFTLGEARKPFQWSNKNHLAKKFAATTDKHLPIAGAPVKIADVLKAVSCSLKECDFVTVTALIDGISLWNEIPNGSSIKQTVLESVREHSLAIFLHTNACSYSSIACQSLCDQFRLTPRKVKQIVNQTLLDRESSIVAMWDKDETYLCIDRGNTTKLQHLAQRATAEVAELSVVLRAADSGRGRGRGRGRGGRGRGRY